MRVLVTGAAGFIGRQATNALVSAGTSVIAVSRSAHAPRSDIEWLRADLTDRDAMRSAIAAAKADRLLHCAWVTEHGKFWDSSQNLTWLGASAELVRAFVESGGRRVVLAGTCAEYEWVDPVLDEATSATRPTTLYGAAKLALWDVVQAFAQASKFSAATGRIFHLYGPGEAPARLIASVARSCLAGVPAECTAGTQIRDFLHVSDVGDALAALTLSDVDGAVNIGSGVPTSIADVVRKTAEAAGRPDLLRLGARPTSPSDPPRLLPALHRMTQELGWTPRIPLEEGLASYVEDLRAE